MANKIIKRDCLVSFLNEYLNVKNISDDSFNGLQVEGKEDVGKIIFAVDAGMETFQKAKELGADMVVVHHGIFWQGAMPCIIGVKKQQIDFLLKHGISLYAAHLPLDLHPEVGNNAQLLKILGFEKEQPFCRYHGTDISFIGKTAQPKSVEEIVNLLEKNLGAKCKVLPFGKNKIQRIAVCSGGGANHGILQEALDKNVDLYLTGDSTEMYHAVKDSKLNVIFAGHHATETVGVKALAEVVSQELECETLFLDIPTNL